MLRAAFQVLSSQSFTNASRLFDAEPGANRPEPGHRSLRSVHRVQQVGQTPASGAKAAALVCRRWVVSSLRLQISLEQRSDGTGIKKVKAPGYFTRSELGIPN